MGTIIIRKPYGYLEERLYPHGWKSFPIDIISLNRIELTKEIISINKMMGEITNEIISINDITNAIFVEIVSINSIELSKEIISLNVLGSSVTLEITSVNSLAAETTIDIIGVNDLLSFNGPYTKEIISSNRIGHSTLTSFSYTVKIYLDDTDISNYVVEWKIEISEESYVNTMSMIFADKNFFTQCDPTINIGDKRIRIKINNLNQEFLLERRSLNRGDSEGYFEIWGRSYIATLDTPYTTPIFDKEVERDPDTGDWYCPEDDTYVPNIWQTSDRMASEVIEDVIGSEFTLDMQIDDFVVRRDTINASGESPIEIVNKLIRVVGARIRTDVDDNVIIKYWKFDITGTVQATFTDLENILMLDEKLEFPEGYNKVLVQGCDDVAESDIGFDIELDSDLNEEQTTFLYGMYIWVRVYRSPFSTDYSISSSLGSIILDSENVLEIITREQSGFSDQTLKPNKPINSVTSIEKYDYTIIDSGDYSYSVGYKTISDLTGNLENVPVVISYTSKYDLYKLIVSETAAPSGTISFEEVISRITVEKN